jgi:hypothetical protein
MKRALLVGVLGAGLTIVGALATALPASAGGRPFSVELSGADEVTGGDPDGNGTAYVTFNQGQGEVCFELTYFDIDTPTRAHIHAAPAGSNGPIVVAFFDFVAPPPSEGCVEADKELIKQIRQNPEGYYVNVHNAGFPGGAIRGQLSK